MRRELLSGPFGRVMAATFMFFMNFASFFLLPLFVKEQGGSEAMVGIVMGAGGLATLAALPLVGTWIDRWGRHAFFIGGGLGMSAAALGYLAVDGIGAALFALRIVQGICFACAFTASTTLAAELAPPGQRAQALGLFGVSTLLTHALAPSLGEEIIRRLGIHALFVVASLFSTTPLWLLGGVPRLAVNRQHSAAAGNVPRIHWVLGIVMTLCGMAFGCVMTYMPTFVHAAGLGRVSYFFGAYTTTAIGTRIFGGGLSDRIGRRAVVMPALLGLSASIFALSQVHSVPWFLAVGAAFGIAQGVSYPTLHAFLVDTCPPLLLGRAQALFNGAFNLGVMSSAFLFGQIADRYGHRLMFMVAATTPLLASGVFHWVSRHGPHESSALAVQASLDAAK
jgi:MFS family permease